MKLDTGQIEGSEVPEIISQALAGEELGVREGTRLLATENSELSVLVRAADELRRRKVGDIVTYVKNRNLNFTNICIGSCKFCAFRRAPDDPDAFVLTEVEIRRKVKEAVAAGATEVCVQGGLHPDFGLEEYLDILKTIREVSRSIHIHAFSPAEFDHAARQGGYEVDEVLTRLKCAGLNSIPGTAAEILVDRVRKLVCPAKISTRRWLEIIRTAHELRIPTTATMLYGIVETPRERVKHLALIRELQMETGGFTEFVPLAFIPFNTELERNGIRAPPDLADSLRVHAVARLMLAGWIENLQASWVKLGPRGAQLMLLAGANDLGGTLIEENITRAAGGRLQVMQSEQLAQLARELGRYPRQRTTIYELLG
jgi:7,8-didemethyl-8-hydroxy-5-deazariboflavin synthase CofH subunit